MGMSKPFSMRVEPWSSFDQQSYNIFTDDFFHEKLFTLRVNQRSMDSESAVNIKAQFEKKN
jgi:hypothetical protein